jgi:hypothetical protein
LNLSTNANSVGNASALIVGGNTSNFKLVTYFGSANRASGHSQGAYWGNAIAETTADVTSLELSTGGSNFDAGTWQLFGSD